MFGRTPARAVILLYKGDITVYSKRSAPSCSCTSSWPCRGRLVVPVPVVGLKVVVSPRWRYVWVYCLLGAKYYRYLVLPPSIELNKVFYISRGCDTPGPWRVFLGCPACILPVSRHPACISPYTVYPISLYRLYIYISIHFAADSLSLLYPAASHCRLWTCASCALKLNDL